VLQAMDSSMVADSSSSHLLILQQLRGGNMCELLLPHSSSSRTCTDGLGAGRVSCRSCRSSLVVGAAEAPAAVLGQLNKLLCSVHWDCAGIGKVCSSRIASSLVWGPLARQGLSTG
jgi:hypothetical protein